MANTKKVLSSVGVPTMCAQIGSALRSAKLLSDALNQAVDEIEEALNDFPVASSISISTSNWHENPDTDAAVIHCMYYYDITNLEIDQYDLPIVTIAPTSLNAAMRAGLCPTCESMNGSVRLWAKQVPDSAIVVNLFIIKGRQDNENPEYDLSYNNEEGE